MRPPFASHYFPSRAVSIATAKTYSAPLALILIAGLCAALRFYRIGAASLWTDEIVSRYYSQVFDLHFQFGRGLSIEPTPPTYTLLLRAWMFFFGYSEAAMRSLSAVACVLSIPPIYFLGRELTGKLQGLLAALLFSLCPASVYFGQEARVYALYTLAVCFVLLSIAVMLRDPHSRLAAAGYLAFGTLCLYLHATGLLFILACGFSIGIFCLLQKDAGRKPLLRWVALNVSVLLLGSPYLIHTRAASHAGGLDWMPRFSLHELITCISAVVSGLSTPRPWPGTIFAAAVLGLLTVSLYLHPLPRRASFILIVVPVLFGILISLASIRRPILLPRTLFWMIVPLCLVAASTLLQSRRMRVAILLSLAAAFGTGLYFQIALSRSEKEPWREALHELARQLERADLVVVGPSSDPMVLTYYAPQAKHIRLWDASLPPTTMNAFAEQLHFDPINQTEILQAIRSKQSVWVISNAFDEKYLTSLRNYTPPTVDRKWFCDGTPCISIAGWSPESLSLKITPEPGDF